LYCKLKDRERDQVTVAKSHHHHRARSINHQSLQEREAVSSTVSYIKYLSLACINV